MNLSLNIIMEDLGMMAGDHIGSALFSHAVCIGNSSDEIPEEAIGIAPYEVAKLFCEKNRERVCLCPEENEMPYMIPENLIPVRGETDIFKLVRKVQDLFHRMQEWVTAMQLSIIREKGLQDLVDLCEPVLKNTIHISDASTNMIAYSRSVLPDDDFSLSLRRDGFFSDKAIELLGGREAVKRLETYPEQGVVHFTKLMPFDIVYRIHRFQNLNYSMTAMLCDHVPLTPGLTDKFNIWIEYLTICIEANWKREQEKKRYNVALFKALIDGTEDGSVTIEDITDNLKLPRFGHFLLLSIQTDSLTHMLLSRRIYELSDLLRNAQVSTYGGRIVALLRGGSQDVWIPEDTVRNLTEQLEHWDIYCGMSEPFSELRDTASAFRQAEMALQYGCRPRGAVLGPEALFASSGRRIIRFTDVCVHSMLWEYSRQNEMFLSSTRYGKLIGMLLASDRKRQTRDASLLYTYLLHERNATETGNLLHMNRNNVIYHIRKIQEMLDVDLDDPLIRFNLISFLTGLAINSEEEE